MISEEDVEKAVDFLRDSAPKIAKARADLAYATEYRKSLKAMIFVSKSGGSAVEREQASYADASYLRHLEAIRSATLEFEKLRAQREGASMKIDAWRSMNANYRGIKI